MSLAALIVATVPAPSAEARLARLSADVGVEIRVVRAVLRASRDDYCVLSDPTPPSGLDRYLPIVDEALRRYPVGFLRRAGVRRVVVGWRVRVQGQPRAAVPEFDRGWLWLDAEVGGRLPAYGRRALHHDLFHMVDRAMAPDAQGRDPAWAALNAPGFRYGNGGWWMRGKGVGDLRTDLPGFLTAYATAAVEEDKAETFSHLLCDSAFVAERAAADPVLRAKVARLKASLAAFAPEIGAAWWPRG